jgi:hypothetical protein
LVWSWHRADASPAPKALFLASWQISTKWYQAVEALRVELKSGKPPAEAIVTAPWDEHLKGN